MSDYKQVNRKHWDAMVEANWGSPFYDVKGWLAGADSLKSIELDLLPSLEDKRLLHLQCHFGQDTLSLARRGANVTGADLSEGAIERARELAALASLQGTFVCSDLYSLPETLDAPSSFDVVFTSWGTIGWLPDLTRWAAVIDHFLAPGGVFVMADFHPIVWMLDEERTGFAYSYFNRGPIEETSEASYTGAAKPTTQEIGWNHSLGDLLGALLNRGLRLEAFGEHDASPYPCFNDVVEVRPGCFQFKGLEDTIPMAYGLRARKPVR